MSSRTIPDSAWFQNLDSMGFWDPRCRRVTKKGQPCKFPIFGGQVYSWPCCCQPAPTISEDDWQRYLYGACGVHRHTEGADHD